MRRHQDVPARWIAQAEVALRQRHQANARDQRGALDEFLFERDQIFFCIHVFVHSLSREDLLTVGRRRNQADCT